jgi:hypothetical protein
MKKFGLAESANGPKSCSRAPLWTQSKPKTALGVDKRGSLGARPTTRPPCSHASFYLSQLRQGRTGADMNPAALQMVLAEATTLLGSGEAL